MGPMNTRYLSPTHRVACNHRLTLAKSIVSRASFLSRSLLSTLVSEAPATPPPPNFEPTRFWRTYEHASRRVTLSHDTPENLMHAQFKDVHLSPTKETHPYRPVCG